MQTFGLGQAVNQALREEMRRDPNVFIAGEGVGVGIHDNPMFPTFGLLKAFGPKRVKDTPVSEAAIAGLAVGAAEAGLRPVIEIMFNPFFTLASDMIVNHAAKLRYLSGGKSSFPLVVRIKSGAGFGAGCQHSHNLEAWAAHCPGLKVVMPATSADAKGLLKSAIRDDNPVIFIEHMGLYFAKMAVPEDDYLIPLGKAEIKRPGKDLTVVTWSGMLGVAVKAAEKLSQENIETEIVDLR
ncbi:MAG: transketolase C-terminal domain-containing protein, partial [Desulfotignum sp.]